MTCGLAEEETRLEAERSRSGTTKPRASPRVPWPSATGPVRPSSSSSHSASPASLARVPLSSGTPLPDACHAPSSFVRMTLQRLCHRPLPRRHDPAARTVRTRATGRKRPTTTFSNRRPSSRASAVFFGALDSERVQRRGRAVQRCGSRPRNAHRLRRRSFVPGSRHLVNRPAAAVNRTEGFACAPHFYRPIT